MPTMMHHNATMLSFEIASDHKEIILIIEVILITNIRNNRSWRLSIRLEKGMILS